MENNTAFTSDATWQPTVFHCGICFGAGVVQRSLPSRTQLSECSLLEEDGFLSFEQKTELEGTEKYLQMMILNEVEREAANTGLNLLFTGGPEGFFFFYFTVRMPHWN